MSIDIIKEMKKDFPNFAKIFLGTTKVTKMISELEKIAQEDDPCRNNIFSRIERILRNPKTQQGPKGLPYFATSIFWQILCPGTTGQFLSEETLLYHEKKLGELIHRYGDKKTKKVLTTLYHGSDRFDMLAHEFHMYHFGMAYQCDFDKEFGKKDGPNFDVYIEDGGFKLAIEVKAANELNRAFRKFPALVTKKPPKPPQGIMPLEEVFEAYDLGDNDASSTIVDCPKDKLCEAFLDAVVHTYEKQEKYAGKMLCAFSLPHECIEDLLIIMREMYQKSSCERIKSLYYLLHDPERHLTDEFASLRSEIYFVQFSNNDDISHSVESAFNDYPGGFHCLNENTL